MTQQMQSLQLSQTRKCPGGPASPSAAKRLYRNLSEKLRGSTSSFEDAYFFSKADRLRKASVSGDSGGVLMLMLMLMCMYQSYRLGRTQAKGHPFLLKDQISRWVFSVFSLFLRWSLGGHDCLLKHLVSETHHVLWVSRVTLCVCVSAPVGQLGDICKPVTAADVRGGGGSQGGQNLFPARYWHNSERSGLIMPVRNWRESRFHLLLTVVLMGWRTTVP